MPLNKDDEFTIDITNSSIPFSTFTANNQTANEQSNISNAISIIMITGISVVSFSLISGLVYLYYQNHMLPHSSDSSMETTATNPLGDEENRDSDYSDFYGVN